MAELQLSKGYVAIVDDDDYPILSQWKWTALVGGKNQKRVYAYRRPWINGRAGVLYLHRFIMEAPAGLDVDHIDHDGLNNCRANLRLATRTQNLARSRRVNKTGFRGVEHAKGAGFTALINSSKAKRVGLGTFKTAEEAARAYDIAAIEAFGEFALLNFPDPRLAVPSNTEE